MLDVVEVGRDLCEQGEEAPVVAEVHQDQGQEGRGRHHRQQRRKRKHGPLVPDVGLRFYVASLGLGTGTGSQRLKTPIQGLA